MEMTGEALLSINNTQEWSTRDLIQISVEDFYNINKHLSNVGGPVYYYGALKKD